VYRVPHAQQANRHGTVVGPAITVPPLQAKLADPRPSCRNAVLQAIKRLQSRTGATEFPRRDIVAEVQASGTEFERQTIYRCIAVSAAKSPEAPTATSTTSATVGCNCVHDLPTPLQARVRVGQSLVLAALPSLRRDAVGSGSG
jgi:hypothetical protein